MYVDSRETEDSSTWDADKLSDVAKAKGGEAEKNKPKTTIVSSPEKCVLAGLKLFSLLVMSQTEYLYPIIEAIS